MQGRALGVQHQQVIGPAVAPQQIDQRQQAQAEREPVARVHAGHTVHGGGPATGIRIRQGEIRGGAVGAEKAQIARSASVLQERCRPRQFPGGGEIAGGHRRERLRWQADEKGPAAVTRGAHRDRGIPDR